jgi:hypothetical protein
MKYYFPFGETVRPLVQQDRSPKKVFVLGVYASAVHARWKKVKDKSEFLIILMRKDIRKMNTRI